jgi:hypothetical protein
MRVPSPNIDSLANSGSSRDDTHVNFRSSGTQQQPSQLARRRARGHHVVDDQDGESANVGSRADPESMTDVFESARRGKRSLLLRRTLAPDEIPRNRKLTRFGNRFGEDFGTMETTFEPPPPVSRDGDDQIKLVKKITAGNFASQDLTELNSQLLIMLVLHSNHQFLQQASIIANRGGPGKPQIEFPTQRAAVSQRVVTVDNGCTFLASLNLSDANLFPAVGAPVVMERVFYRLRAMFSGNRIIAGSAGQF